MPNFPIFDRSKSPIITKGTNNYTQKNAAEPPQSAVSATTGGFFSINASNSASLGLLGGTVNISVRIANPSNSGKTLYLKQIYGNTNVSLSLLSSFSGQVTALSGGTLTSPSTLTPATFQLGSSATSVMTATSSTSAITGGTSFALYPLFPGPFFLEYSGSILVPPGQALSVNVFGSLSVLGILGTAVEVIWWEA
ncbi:hypothetical protein [Paenibacillus sp. NPDC058071]|uniref:hypothetical protein n=1 Tax=Paenibacillus sp. NPDC058071 TaxID=3346326 RepID=UPI0036D912A8